MHKAKFKTNKGIETIYFTYSLHSSDLNLTIFCIGDYGIENVYVKDENILSVEYDEALINYRDTHFR